MAKKIDDLAFATSISKKIRDIWDIPEYFTKRGTDGVLPAKCRPLAKTYLLGYNFEETTDTIAEDFCKTFPQEQCEGAELYMPLKTISGVKAFSFENPIPYQIVIWYNGSEARECVTLCTYVYRRWDMNSIGGTGGL